MTKKLLVVSLLTAFASTASGQATRTWVSGVGNDGNPCSRTAPCKTFAGAFPQTAPDGEIDALDPGGFGTLTISNGITLEGGGTFTSILSSATNGINVNAPGAVVFLRNISIQGTGGVGADGLNGIRILAAAAVYIEGCTISNFSQYGIDVQKGADVFIKDTTVKNVVLGAIRVEPSSGSARIFMDNVRLEGSGYGLRVAPNSVATVRRGGAAGNTGAGFWADGAGAELTLAHGVAANNQVGIRASAGGVVRTLDVTVTNNTNDGLLPETGGAVVAFTDNQMGSNGSAAICEIDQDATPIACPASRSACPAPPACPTPKEGVKTCKKCRTRHGVTNCTGCSVGLQ